MVLIISMYPLIVLVRSISLFHSGSTRRCTPGVAGRMKGIHSPLAATALRLRARGTRVG